MAAPALQSAGQVIIYSNIEHTSRCPLGCMVKALCCLHRLVLAGFALQSSWDTSRCLHRGDMIKAVPSALPCLVSAFSAAPAPWRRPLNRAAGLSYYIVIQHTPPGACIERHGKGSVRLHCLVLVGASPTEQRSRLVPASRRHDCVPSALPCPCRYRAVGSPSVPA